MNAKIFLLVVLMMALSIFRLNAQEKTITGSVVDMETQLPIPGVTIQVKGTNFGSVTDDNGVYSLDVQTADDIVVFNCLGYSTHEVRVGVSSVIDVAMSMSAFGLEDVVVIGYGKTTKKEVTGAVSTLKASDFSPGTFTSVAGLLQGKVAGLSIVNSSGGDPNAQYEILLRGTNTLQSGQGPLIVIDGVAGADIRNINFQEVESFDVLKDGSAAAIYGTRGTNGVIIITTKRARAGTTSVEYDGQVTIQTVARRAVPMTASEFKSAIDKYKPEVAGGAKYLYGNDTDWFDAITRTPISHKHSLAVSGGSESFSHRTVLNIEQNQGVQKKNDANNFLIKSNVRQTILKGWVDLNYDVYAAKRKYTPAHETAFEQTFFHNPTEPIYDSSDQGSGGYSNVVAMDYYNPVAMINEREREVESDDLGASIRATLNVLAIKGLKWDNFVSYNQQRYEDRTYYTRYYPGAQGSNGKAEIVNEYSNDIQYESTLNYSNKFGDHSLQAIVGYAYEQSTFQSSSMGNHGFDVDNWLTNNMGAGTALQGGLAEMGSYKRSNTYVAFFGRVMYNYKEKYLASISLRRDGSSRFGANNKWGWFPAISLGWRIDQEGFLKDVRWIDDLKLRAGYGVTGNQDFADYQSLMLMKVAGSFYYNGNWINTYTPASNPNADLAWEKKAEFNVGLDFGFFDSRLRGSIDYYNRKTSDLLYLYSVPTPPYVYDELFTNVGEISNQGVEITLSADIFKNKDFYWNSYLTFSKNSNKLVSFKNDEFKDGVYQVGWLPTPVGAFAQRLEEGQSLGTFYGPVWLGVGADGKDILKGAVDGEVPESEWEKLGCAYPDFQLNWGNTLRYKNWDFSFLFRASIGGKIFNRFAAEYENITGFGQKNILASWLDDTKFTGQVEYSSKYLENASYLKLDNVSLGYTLDFNSKYFKSLRMNLTAQNLFCITSYSGVDPEVSLSGLAPGIESLSYYPRTTTVTFGVNLIF